VRTLLDWYRADEDIDRRMPLLSAFLGHADPASTYWYYSDSGVIPMSARLSA
jgi:integrase